MRWLVVLVTVAGCTVGIVRAPDPMPASGVVECTDTMEVPVTRVVMAVVAGAVLAYAAANPQDAIENGGLILIPTAGVAVIAGLMGAAEGYTLVDECRQAKRRGALIVEAKQRERDRIARARAEAGDLWKQAAAAARSGDCERVRVLDPQVLRLDPDLHATVFARDVAIARCLQP